MAGLIAMGLNVSRKGIGNYSPDEPFRSLHTYFHTHTSPPTVHPQQHCRETERSMAKKSAAQLRRNELRAAKRGETYVTPIPPAESPAEAPAVSEERSAEPPLIPAPGGGHNVRRNRWVCYNWQRGACERGDTCRFTHSNNAAERDYYHHNKGGEGYMEASSSQRPGDWLSQLRRQQLCFEDRLLQMRDNQAGP